MERKINIVGLGYIGLPTALMLADKGCDVCGTDCNAEVVEGLKNGTKVFVEDGLSELYDEAMGRGIRFENSCIEADVYIIAVPTPYDKFQKKIDPSYVISAVKEVLVVCPDHSIIAIESTIAPGTIDRFIRPIIPESKNIELAHVPERIIPGNIIGELRKNSRTVGADSLTTAEILKDIYGTFCEGSIVLTDIKTAEMTKVVENTYRDINIAFANELMKISRQAGLDVYEIIRIANNHPRVNILTPGPGVGGHCISVDPWFLVGEYPGLANIILAARKINDSMPEFVLDRLHEIMEECGVHDISRVGFYGLTYKENVDDVRESPTLQLIECMNRHLAYGGNFYDPYVKSGIVEGQVLDFEQFLDGSDIVVVMVGHSHIIKNQGRLKNKIVLDTRNVLNVENAIHL